MNGTIIHGTHRLQDLIPAFLETLEYIDAASYGTLKDTNAQPFDARDIGSEHPFWNSNEAQQLLEDLFDALNAAAPEDCYFGSHPGDGSDFGFWPIDDD